LIEVAFHSPARRDFLELNAKFGPSGYLPQEVKTVVASKTIATLNVSTFFI
jgi:hypothetical protein